jgi:hypothetical protein
LENQDLYMINEDKANAIRVTDKSNPLTVNKIRDDSNLRFESLTEKQNEESENDNSQQVAFLVADSK